MLTREDANSESALVAEWLVEDRAEVRKGTPVCVVETSKASIELESPGDGILVQLVAAGIEAELGSSIALVAESAAEVEAAEQTRSGTRARAVPPGEPSAGRATRKATELAALHGIDLTQIDKPGFITAEDVESLVAAAQAPAGESDPVLAGLSVENVSLPAVFGLAESDGVLDPGFLASLRSDPQAFAELSSSAKCEAYRSHGARIGEGVRFGDGALIVAPRIVVEDGVLIGDGARITCEEVFAAGELALLGKSFRLACRRAFLGAGFWSGDGIQIGGGGNRDPWATFAMGELGFIGDEAFINVCRPVLIGREAFVTMRSTLLTHNVGHSVLEGFENRFAGIVIEDRAQIGVGAFVYPGCRIGREAIVASNSYVVTDIPAGTLAVGVPARVSGSASRRLSHPQQVAIARRIVEELEELLRLRGLEVLSHGEDGFELPGPDGAARVLFVEELHAREIPAVAGETVVLTLGLEGSPPEDCVVLDLLARRIHGGGGPVLETVREFCRKRGIRFEPGPWRYREGLI